MRLNSIIFIEISRVYYLGFYLVSEIALPEKFHHTNIMVVQILQPQFIQYTDMETAPIVVRTVVRRSKFDVETVSLFDVTYVW